MPHASFYARDDIYCGSAHCTACPRPTQGSLLEDGVKRYLVIDTNVALHQMDFLETKALTNVIVSFSSL